MTSITNSLYSNLSSYYTTSLADQVSNNSGSSTSRESTGLTGDTVSLSSAVKTAQTREYLGLNPTGPLTLSDIQTTAAQQEETVNGLLASAMETLGIDAAQQVSLSFDDNGNIVIAEDFAGSDALEESLNSDEGFVQAFSGLSANNEVMDYAASIQSKSATLADYINGDTSDSDLLSLASTYSSLKSAGSSIEALWNISHSETPYTYVYN